jgi:hypothetical protein
VTAQPRKVIANSLIPRDDPSATATIRNMTRTMSSGMACTSSASGRFSVVVSSAHPRNAMASGTCGAIAQPTRFQMRSLIVKITAIPKRT